MITCLVQQAIFKIIKKIDSVFYLNQSFFIQKLLNYFSKASAISSARHTKTSHFEVLVTYSVTLPINRRSTAFNPVAPTTIKSMLCFSGKSRAIIVLASY